MCDPVLPVAQGRSAARLIPGATFVELDTGHLPFAEAPDAFLAAALPFLDPAAPGIATGVMLAIARVAGETAPLLFTALGNRLWSTALDKPIGALSVQIYTYATSPYDEWHPQASAPRRSCWCSSCSC